MLLLGNGLIITHNDSKPLIENGCVVINGGLIEDCGLTWEMRDRYPEYEFIDVKGKIIMPGLINTHTHIYSEFARGMVIPNMPVSKNFMDILENLWWRIDKAMTLEDVRYSTYTALIECIKNGVTTVFDHHASYSAISGSLFTIGDAAREIGIRVSLCYEVSDRLGADAAKEGIRENIEWIDYNLKNKNDMQKAMFGLHASFTLSNRTLDRCKAELEGKETGFHVHVAEGASDVHNTIRDHSKRVVNRFLEYGILGNKSLAVHCIHVNSSEMDLLKDTDTVVVHNPQSNMGNAVGCSSVPKMLEKGIILGLGTDGYTSDMFESMKATNLIHKHNLCDPSVMWKEPPEMLFYNNREIAGRFFDTPLGIIEKGAAADIILVDYKAPTPITEKNIYSHILFGFTSSKVDTVIIDGKIIMKNRKLVSIDEEKVFEEARSLAGKLWSRV